jgi:hypothetical protein
MKRTLLKHFLILETPSQEIFDEMKKVSTSIWSNYDNKFGYVDKKMEIINNLKNVQDNAMVMYRMFDIINQSKFRYFVSESTLEYIDRNL